MLGCGGIVVLGICGFIAVTAGLFAAVAGAKTPTPFVVAGGASALNQTASVKNWDVTVTSIEKPGKDLVWSKFGNQSTAVGTWVVVVVKMRNTGSANFGVNSFDFELRASGGTKYSVSTEGGLYSESKGGQSLGGQVPPSTEAIYYIPFDVAPTATEMQFVFKQDKQPVFTIGNATP